MKAWSNPSTSLGITEVLIRVGTQISPSYFKTHLGKLERIHIRVKQQQQQKKMNQMENEDLAPTRKGQEVT